MNDVTNINSFLTRNYGIENKKQEEEKSNELGQSAFLELMITQLNNQDPLSPQDNTEFVAQLAQFSSVEGIERLNNTMDSVASTFRSSQALQASAMVGRKVHVPGNTATLQEGSTITGIADLESSTNNMVINVYDRIGTLVRRIDLGATAQGEINFEWDGKNDEDIPMPAGAYRIEAVADIGGESTTLPLAVSANVNSVTIGKNNDLTLNVEGVGAVGLSEVREIL